MSRRTTEPPRAKPRPSAPPVTPPRRENKVLALTFAASALAAIVSFNTVNYLAIVSTDVPVYGVASNKFVSEDSRRGAARGATAAAASERPPNHRLVDLPLNADYAWNHLLREGRKLMDTNSTPFAAIEVGMSNPRQCIEAAQKNFEAHCVEPSPVSFRRCREGVQRNTQDVRDRIRLYNVAAGSTSSDLVDFKSTGSTGDMVGGEGSDMWLMTKKKGSPNATATESGNIVKVKTSRLDDLISAEIPSGTEIFVAKIDVQGFEPYVFEGLSESIQNQRIMFFLFEYWPKGMDFMLDVPFDSDDICKASVRILENLSRAGYKLFALLPEVHPHSYSSPNPKRETRQKWPEQSASSDKKLRRVRDGRPLDGLMENCRWYYKLEREVFPQDDYHMGFWSDFIAVSPRAPHKIVWEVASEKSKKFEE